jgi:peptidyl-prolyl cis-trans isomerase SurA
MRVYRLALVFGLAAGAAQAQQPPAAPPTQPATPAAPQAADAAAARRPQPADSAAHPGATVIQTVVPSVSIPMSATAAASQATAGLAAAALPPSSGHAPSTSPEAPPAGAAPPPAEATGTAAAAEPAAPEAPAIPLGVTIPLERIVAIVGTEPVLWSSVLESVNVRRAQGLQIPTDSAGQLALINEVVNDLVDQELLVQKAHDLKVDVADEDVAAGVDAQIQRVRAQFSSDAEYKSELKKAGFGTPEEYRKGLLEQAKRSELQRRVVEKLKEDGKLIPVNVSEAEVDDAFDKHRNTLPRRPATVTFRQIVIAPKPSAAAKAAAHARADSLLADLKRGADFSELAKRASEDPASRETGGDLGWTRRGIMVPEFDRWMFALQPGQISPIVETEFGYHIIKVDRVRPGEVKARHILVKWKIDSAQVTAARNLADSVLRLWEDGARFDTLVAHYHDPNEEKGSLQPYPRDSMPPSYQQAFAGKTRSDFVGPFPIPDRVTGAQKFVIAEVIDAEDGGDYTVSDLRQTIRAQLQEERSFRRLLDGLRKETYVSIRIEAPPANATAPKSGG